MTGAPNTARSERTKILFFGNERLATGLSTDAPVLRALIDNNYEITGVVVAQKQASASRKARDLEIVQVAAEHNIPVIAPARLGDAVDEIRGFGAQIGVLVAYGKIVPQEIIDAFPRGIVNIHPSLLPLHRGPTPLESVILQGERETGVSIMQLALAMDAGPVYSQSRVSLRGDETKQELADRLIALGKDMLIENLPAILDGSLQPQVQDDSQATYDQLITKNASSLDFNKSASELEREVRAYASWPRSRCTVGKYEIIVTRAHVIDAAGTPGSLWLQDKQLGIHCQSGTLVFDSVIPNGKKEMDASAFLAGYPLS